MSTTTVPASMGEALGMLESAVGFLADADAAQMPAEALAREHPPLLAGLRDGHVFTRSVALQLAKWTRLIPADFRDESEEFLVAAARAGADLRSLARMAAEIRYRTASADPEDEPGKDPGRGLSLDTTFGLNHGSPCQRTLSGARAFVF